MSCRGCQATDSTRGARDDHTRRPHPGSADGDEAAATAGPARKHRRAVLVAVVAVVAGLGLVAFLILQGQAETNPLDSEAPALSEASVQPGGECTYDPARGGLVAHFDVRTRDAGRFTVDVQAVTDDGADDLDISTPHVVRVTVPFYGGRARKQFDVVVPLTEADYQQGYRKCRYWINGME